MITRSTILPLRLRKKIHNITPNKSYPEHFKIRVFDNLYQGNTSNYIDKKVYIYGMHEASTIRFMRQTALSVPDCHYWDIGTNSGFHVTAMMDVCSKITGFEPWDKVRAAAQAIVDLNNATHVKIYDFGLSNKNENLDFYLPENENLGTGSFLHTGQNQAIKLKVRKGDDFVKETKSYPDLIKIDVEGFEFEVLEGLAETLKKAKPIVVFELSPESRERFHSEEQLATLFPDNYVFAGLARSREFPKFKKFKLQNRYENVVAYPEGKLDRLDIAL